VRHRKRAEGERRALEPTPKHKRCERSQRDERTRSDGMPPSGAREGRCAVQSRAEGTGARTAQL
jgi:hypothetical protein